MREVLLKKDEWTQIAPGVQAMRTHENNEILVRTEPSGDGSLVQISYGDFVEVAPGVEVRNSFFGAITVHP